MRVGYTDTSRQLWLRVSYYTDGNPECLLSEVRCSISDYQAVDPRYGTLAEADALIQGCHDRGLKILFDLGKNSLSMPHQSERDL